MQKKRQGTVPCLFFISGDSGIRTRDLCVANAALSQLSYIPKYRLPDYYIRAAAHLSSINFQIRSVSNLGSAHLLGGCLRKEGISRLSCFTLLLTPLAVVTGLAGWELVLPPCALPVLWEDP